MRAVVIGLVIAVLVIGAFFAGGYFDTAPKGPAEKIGEAIDDAANQ